MTAVIVLGAGSGLSGELLRALRASCTVLIVDKLPPSPPDPFEVGAALLVDAMREPPPERPQFYPESRPNLRNIAISQVPGVQRTGKRPREQRTRK